MSARPRLVDPAAWTEPVQSLPRPRPSVFRRLLAGAWDAPVSRSLEAELAERLGSVLGIAE